MLKYGHRLVVAVVIQKYVDNGLRVLRELRKHLQNHHLVSKRRVGVLRHAQKDIVKKDADLSLEVRFELPNQRDENRQ